MNMTMTECSDAILYDAKGGSGRMIEIVVEGYIYDTSSRQR